MALTPAGSAVADSQWGVVSRRQLLEAGVTRETLRWRVGRDWRLLLPGIYALQTGLPSLQQRLVAALLLGGEDAWLAASTAAALHGVRACSVTMPVRVLVEAPRRPGRIAWVDIRSTCLAGEPVVSRGPLRLGCLPRAVVDAASETADERSARALVIEAVQRRLVRVDDLEHWVDARGRAGSVRLRRILDEVAAGAWSVPEGDLLALVRTSRSLPRAMANLVQSRTFHADGLDWDATVETGSDLSPVRVVVVGVTPAALARDPAAQLARVHTGWTCGWSGIRWGDHHTRRRTIRRSTPTPRRTAGRPGRRGGAQVPV